MCVCPQTGQAHSYSLIHHLFRILFLLVFFLYGCLASFLWGTLFPFFVLFWVVCLGLCLSAFHLLLPVLVVPLCRVSFGLCAFLVVLLSGCCGVLFSCCCCSVFPAWLLCSFLLFVFGVVAVWTALSWLCPLPPHPPWLVLWRLLVQSVLC